MIHVAIVDDEEEQIETTRGLLLRYEKEHDTAIRITTFNNAVTFLDPYKGDYDIVILDVKMPYLNGIDAARKLREMDEQVILFFLTTMEQYALRGYEVAAMDYLIKPINYFDFALRFSRAVKKLDKENDQSVILKTETGIVRVFPSQIYYVEVSGHYCLYHTAVGEYRQYYSIKKLEQELRENNFTYTYNIEEVLRRMRMDTEFADASVGKRKSRLVESPEIPSVSLSALSVIQF